MRRALDDLRARLSSHGWQLAHESFTDAAGGARDVSWRLASSQPPIGRQVLVDFRVHEISYEHWGFPLDDLVTRFGITIRFSTSQASPEYFAECNYDWHDARNFFRVLEWFRDPTGHNLYHQPLPGDWLPPDDWDAERWGAGIESTWETTALLEEMLHAAGLTAAGRKLRLVACALCRQLPVSRLDDKNLLAIEMAERYAEGEIPKRELKRVSKHSSLAWLGQLDPAEAMHRAAGQLQQEDARLGKATAIDTLREIVGHPSRPVQVRRGWLRANGGVVQRLIDAAVAGDFGVLPVLADALEDAGCSESAILEHCRQAKPHARGCWVVDLLAGKA